MRSTWFFVGPCRAASSRPFETALPTGFAVSRALPACSSKYPAGSTASPSEAVSSSSWIAGLRMRGLISIGTRVEVVSGRQAPARLASVHQAVIGQVVVGVGDQYVENQPPPQRFHVGLTRGAVPAQRINNSLLQFPRKTLLQRPNVPPHPHPLRTLPRLRTPARTRHDPARPQRPRATTAS
jgi:hypothetical protein